MSGTKVQWRGGTTSQHNSFTGADREVTVDTTKKTLVVHDGSKQGGYPLATEADLQSAIGDLGSASSADIVQGTGSSTTDVMSQKAVTDALDNIDIDLPDIVSSNTDTSGGNKLITQGWMGLGISQGLPRPNNVNNAVENGFYAIHNDMPNAPPISGDGAMIVVGEAPNSPNSSGGDIMQIATMRGGDDLWIRGADNADSNGDPNWGEWQRIMIAPIGMCYTQYPGTDTPSTLFGGTWTLMFNTEGVFFRTEGGEASSFGGGIQGDAMRNLTGRITQGSPVNFSGTSGVFTRGGDAKKPSTTSSSGRHNSYVDFNASRQVTTAPEFRPRNRTIRVWRKTAH